MHYFQYFKGTDHNVKLNGATFVEAADGHCMQPFAILYSTVQKTAEHKRFSVS